MLSEMIVTLGGMTLMLIVIEAVWWVIFGNFLWYHIRKKGGKGDAQ